MLLFRYPLYLYVFTFSSVPCAHVQESIGFPDRLHRINFKAENISQWRGGEDNWYFLKHVLKTKMERFQKPKRNFLNTSFVHLQNIRSQTKRFQP